MPEKLQTKANHTRLDPGFHFVILPGLFVIVVWTAVHEIRHPGTSSVLFFFLAALTLALAFKARIYCLKVQDRVIRLEEKLRLSALAPNLAARPGELSESQLIALRFASDAELPALAQRAAAEKLTNKQIKEAIQNWRPDYWRV